MNKKTQKNKQKVEKTPIIKPYTKPGFDADGINRNPKPSKLLRGRQLKAKTFFVELHEAEAV